MSFTGTPSLFALDADTVKCPYPFFAHLRSRPVEYVSEVQAYVVSRHEDILAVLRDPERFSSRKPFGPIVIRQEREAVESLLARDPDFAEVAERLAPRRTPVLIHCDPPRHARQRRLVSRAFAPRRVAERADRIRQIAETLVDRFADRGHVEIVSEFTVPLPITVIAEMLGVPADHMATFKRWSDDFLGAFGNHSLDLDQMGRIMRSQAELFEYFAAQIDLRRHRPTDDLVSDVVNARFEGDEPLSDDEMLGMFGQFLVAGNETTTSLLTGAVQLLAQDPVLFNRLRREPALIEPFVEEALRLVSPAQSLFRLATEDTEIGGVPIPKGAYVLLVYASANRQEDVFPDPDRPQLDRNGGNSHLAFGFGEHYCIGAALGRLEARIALCTLLERLDDLAVVPGQDLPYEPSYVKRTLQRLELTFTARRPAPPGPSLAETLATDTRPVPPALRERSFTPCDLAEVGVERYLSLDFHHQEIDNVWRKVWQMACRDQDIPAAGDHVVYDIGDDSLIVVRTPDGTIKAFHNACLHRGTMLRPCDGTVERFRCRYHGFTWNLDGQLSEVPSPWDFPDLDRQSFCLPQARVDTWGGFVFVCMDAGTEPLEKYLENLPEQFRDWPLEQRHKAVHVAKVVPCNWKAAMEAFAEGLHITTTHPQVVPYFGDENSQYDLWPGVRHVSRVVATAGTPSPRGGRAVEEQEIADTLTRDVPIAGQDGRIVVPEGHRARPLVADAVRNHLAAATGVDLSRTSDSELLDTIQYFLFPNFAPWAGIGAPLVYRWRPYGHDPGRCVMEVMLLFVHPADRPLPKGVPIHWLGEEETFADAPELGALGPVLDQDLHNLVWVQKGLRATRRPSVTLSVYQESRIRHFHETLDAYLRS